MRLSRPEGMRWVLNGIDPETIRTAKTLSARHDVFLCQVIDQAVAELEHKLYDEGYLPDGWTEY